ncbi:MAG: response regulator transcription factor, partial [Chloroflexota bacterium]
MLRLNPPVTGNVLCVDDDPYLTDLFHYALTRDGYTVDVACTGAEALHIARLDPPDVVVLNLHLPDMNGFTLCGRLRKTLHIPVIMLIALSTDAEVLMAFEAGADDCLAKPFNMQILSYRIRAVLCRGAGSNMLGGPMKILYRLGSGTFHAEENEVTGRIGRVKLTATQGKILRLLLENEGRVVSAEQILVKLWSFETESDVTVVKSHMSNLRKKLAACLGGDEVIHTIAGIGYTVRKPV